MASLSGVYNLQSFTNLGDLADGYRLYTYSAGTTTHKIAYTDPAGTISHTYTSDGSGGLYIALDARGEIPAPLFLTSGGYDLALKTAAGATVWTRRAYGSSDGVDTLRADLADTSSASNGPAMVGYDSSRAYSGSTVGRHLRGIRSVADAPFNAIGDGTLTTAQMLTAVTAAWTSALANGHDLYFPPGTYDIGGTNNFPFRNPVSTSLLDCGNVTIWGAGPASILKTSGPAADALQINACKNLHFRNFALHPHGSDTAGSNGISITNGWDNLTFDGVHVLNAKSVDATTHVDGGKALTLQPGTTSNECGSIVASIYAKGCAEGFGYEADLVTSMTKKAAIDVEVVAEDCFYGVKFAAGAASGALSTEMSSGMRVRAHTINCQRDVVVNRMHGGDIDCHVVTTKTAAARRLSPSAVAWFAADTVVEALVCTYAHHARIRVQGNKGACDYKAHIGATTAGSSGLTGATDDCIIELDIGGTAATANVLDVDSGGSTLNRSRLGVSVRTASSLPTAFYAASLLNALTIGQIDRMVTPKVSGVITLAQGTDGTTETGRLDLAGNITRLQGKGTATANAITAGLYDQAGALRLGVINGSGIVIGALTSGSVLGAYIGKHAVYDGAGVFIGYIPVYA